MKIHKIFIIIFVLALSLTCMQGLRAQDGEIIIPDNIKADIDQLAAQPKMMVPTSTEMIQAKHQVFKNWVSASIDFNKVERRASKRFKRDSFTQEVSSPALRTLDERLEIDETKKTMRPLMLKKFDIKPIEQPARLLYREGPMHYEFAKIEELTPVQAMPQAQAINLAKDFCLKNNFIEETAKDKIGKTYVYERRVNEEGEGGKRDNDYLVQQDVIFERWYEGKPVINSKVVLGVKPNTKEIMTFKHLNWVNVKEEEAQEVSSQNLKMAAASSGGELEQRISAKIRKLSGKFRRAQVKKTVSAWFQTDDGLVPVLVFEVQLDFGSAKGLDEDRSYIEAINLAGSDDIFFKDRQASEQPEAAK